jgi:hypothetical protein
VTDEEVEEEKRRGGRGEDARCCIYKVGFETRTIIE